VGGEPLLIYLILAFPSGRLGNRFDRVLVGSLVLIALTLVLPTALLVARYPEPSTWTSCHGGRPDNRSPAASTRRRAPTGA
jgi:hypothetical protein